VATSPPVVTKKPLVTDPVSGKRDTYSPVAGETVQATVSGTTAPPDARETMAIPVAQPPASPPLATIALIGAGCVIVIGGGFFIRRFLAQRQKPAPSGPAADTGTSQEEQQK
jgi:hypothetical protein